MKTYWGCLSCRTLYTSESDVCYGCGGPLIKLIASPNEQYTEEELNEMEKSRKEGSIE